MPNTQIEPLEHNKLKLTFTLTQEEAKPYLDEAAQRISTQSKIPGFRPGKAGYDVVKQRVGEMKIYEEALETIIRKSYVQALLAENIDTVGSPKIDVVKLAPDNDIVFTAEVSKMPTAKTLADYNKLSIDVKNIVLEDKEINLALRDIQRMQTKEVRATSEDTVGEADKIIVSMNMKRNGVGVEGGQAPNHAIYLNEDYYIPGLKKEVLGMKEGEERTFSLTFPKDHAQKMLAGKPVEFELTLKELFHLEPPALDDAFAATLGMKDFPALKDAISQNLLAEKEKEEHARQEREMLETVAKNSIFDAIPDLLVNEEINKMTTELQRAVEAQGAEFDTYLESLGKTLTEMKLDFTPQALTRIKVALSMRAVADKEKIEVDDKDLDAALDKAAEQYKENKEAREQIYSPQYRDYMEQMLKNRKVIEFLRSVMVK
jgi:trigger factor